MLLKDIDPLFSSVFLAILQIFSPEVSLIRDQCWCMRPLKLDDTVKQFKKFYSHLSSVFNYFLSSVLNHFEYKLDYTETYIRLSPASL